MVESYIKAGGPAVQPASIWQKVHLYRHTQQIWLRSQGQRMRLRDLTGVQLARKPLPVTAKSEHS